ncbi:MAG: hypothetical protein IE909_09900, partial [Campylobacterales bacterium]|nr:hypothetical protein [Campylobacterales bacterium]
ILFEIGARPGGGATPQIVEMITGIEYLKLSAKIATGETILEEELKQKFQKSAIYHFLTLKDVGKKIFSISGLEKINSSDGVIDFELFSKEGDIIKEVQTGKDRQGFAVIVTDNRNEAIKNADLVENSIKFEFEDRL